MERNYWIHRISHFAEISYPLLDNNYLSYGFSYFENDGFIEGVRNSSQTCMDKWPVFGQIEGDVRFSVQRDVTFSWARRGLEPSCP